MTFFAFFRILGAFWENSVNFRPSGLQHLWKSLQIWDFCEQLNSRGENCEKTPKFWVDFLTFPFFGVVFFWILAFFGWNPRDFSWIWGFLDAILICFWFSWFFEFFFFYFLGFFGPFLGWKVLYSPVTSPAANRNRRGAELPRHDHCITTNQ